MDRIWNDHIPRRYITMGWYKRNETEKSITYPTGAKMFFKGADRPDLIYGDEYDFIVVDEASRMKESAWNAVSTVALPRKACVRIIGNIKGRKNWFYKLCRRKEHEGKGYHNMTYLDNPFFDHSAVEELRKTISEEHFNEAFLNKSLSDNGIQPFNMDTLLSVGMPGLSQERTYAYGIDIGGVKDYTVIVGMSINGEITFLQRFKEPDPILQEKKILDLIGKGSEYVIVDATGKGSHIALGLKKSLGNRCIQFYISPNSRKGNQKQELICNLIFTVARGLVRLPMGIVTDPTAFASDKYNWLWDEFDNFGAVEQNGYTSYQALEGTHDDGVMAVALVNHLVGAVNKNFGGWAKGW
jgi:hypothetical protein